MNLFMKGMKKSIMTLILLGLLLGTSLLLISPVSGTLVTVSKSTNVHFPDKSKSTLQYTVRVTRDEEDSPEIRYSIDEITYDPYGRFLDIWVDDNNILNTTFSNDKTGTLTTDRLRSLGTHTIKIQIYSGSYGDGCYVLKYLKLDNLGFDYGMEKIALFMWQDYDPWAPKAKDGGSGAITIGEINNYCDVLEDQGYTTYKYENPSSWIAAIGFLDYCEDENSIVLIYIGGHGSYGGDPAISYIRVNDNVWVDSDDLRIEIDKFESKRILLIVDACKTGGFIDDCAKDGVSVITSNDYTHLSAWFYAPFYIDYAYCRYSHRFFDKIFGSYSFGSYTEYYDDYNTHNEVRDHYSWCYGMKSLQAWHSFFGP
ncbi:MAG: hypothetical protein GPJ52_02600 [Candidatus Heimdallarchaeota archaeon]|nr:hypothetical protein [Candidatus Heimdallarchaeota archaeon]